jgi:hypothetical protein
MPDPWLPGYDLGTRFCREPEGDHPPLRRVDPREDDPSREGIFRSHNCSRCQSGAKPCVRGATNRCEYPIARNH